MERINSLKPGQVINNNELAEIFHCSTQGGMRRSIETKTLVIVSNHVKSIYDDRWVGDTLYYTGMGTEGDQDFGIKQNNTLYYSKYNGVSIHLFEVFIEKQYTYIGKVVLAGKPFYEEQPDSKGNNRKVCVSS